MDVELSQPAADALFALFAVKLDLVSESAVEKAWSQRDEGQSLEDHLVANERLSSDQAQTVKAQMDPEVIAGYRIEGEAGRGGMGVVYRARQLSMDRVAALKVLARRLSQDESYVIKFLDEARAAAKLNHENIVSAIDAGEANGLYYFVMEFVDGESVADVLDRDGTIPWERAVELVEQTGRGLGHAHAAGIVHRDVKPENIMIGSEGEAKLCDLGLAKPLVEAGTGEKSSMTEGTPYYCSPEQALGRTDIDAKSDVYSLGVTLYHMLKGSPPFDGDTPRSILLQQVRSPFPNLDKELPDVPAPVRTLIKKMVVKDREKRLPSIRAFEEELLKARSELSARHRAPGAVAAAQAPRNPNVIYAALGLLFLICAGVGAAAVSSMSGDPDAKTDEVSQVDKTGEAPVQPRGTTKRVGDDPPETGPVIDDPIERKANDLYQAALSYQRENTSDPMGALERYQKVVKTHPTSKAATKAQSRLAALRDQLKRQNERALERLTEQVLRLVGSGKYRSALVLVSTFRDTWKSYQIADLRKNLTKIQGSITRQAKATVDRYLGDAEAGDAAARVKLKGLLNDLPETTADTVRKRLAQLSQGAARARWSGVQARIVAALQRADIASAKRLVQEATEDPQLKDVAADVRLLRNDVLGIDRAQQAFLRNVERSRGQAVTFEVTSGSPVSGKLSAVQGWTATIDGQPFDLRLAKASKLLTLALPAREGRYNALFFAIGGAPHAATAALDAYVRTGGKDDPALRARLRTLRGTALEARAKQLLDRLTDPKLEPTRVLSGVKAFPPELRATQAYAARYSALQDAYVRARAAGIAGDDSRLFNGDYKKDRRGRVTLAYDFKELRQTQDWVVDAAADPKSRVAWRKDGGVLMRGVCLLQAKFAPGYLKVTLKAEVQDKRSPNVNLILNEAGTWNGILVGAGFRYKLIRNIKIDASAKKRSSYVVDLPANVLIVLGGQEPRRRMPLVLTAEEKPALKRSSARLQFSRSTRGAIKVKVGSRITASVNGIPKGDQAGRIGVAPFGSELLVEELEVTGVLDPAWLKTRAVALSRDEAKAVPPPTKPGN